MWVFFSLPRLCFTVNYIQCSIHCTNKLFFFLPLSVLLSCNRQFCTERLLDLYIGSDYVVYLVLHCNLSLQYNFSFYYISSYEKFSFHRRRKEEAVEPEVDPERDQRTVFAFQVAFWTSLFTL